MHYVEVATTKSCDKRINFLGRKGSAFVVKARLSTSKGYVIKEYSKGNATAIPDVPPLTYNDVPFVEGGEEDGNAGDDDDDVEDDDDECAEDEEGPADEEGDEDEDDILGEPQAVDAIP